MKNLGFLSCGMMMAVCSLVFYSCGSDGSPSTNSGDEKEDLAYSLTVSETVLSLGFASGQTCTFTIVAKQGNKDADWTIQATNLDFVTLSSMYGSGTSTITVTAKSTNSTSSPKTVSIVVRCGDQTKVVTVTQSAQSTTQTTSLSVQPDVFTSLAVGAACNFSYGSDVKTIYVGLFPTSSLSNCTTTADKVSFVKTHGATLTSSTLDNVVYNSSQTAGTDMTLLAIGYASNGKTCGSLYVGTFTTGSTSNQPQVTIGTISKSTYNGSNVWKVAFTMNSYCYKFYNLAYTSSQDICFAAWCMAYNYKKGNVSACTSSDTYTVSRGSESDIHIYTRGLSSNLIWSNVVRYRSYSGNSSAKSGVTTDKNHNESVDYKSVKPLWISCVY